MKAIYVIKKEVKSVIETLFKIIKQIKQVIDKMPGLKWFIKEVVVELIKNIIDYLITNL